MVARVVSTGSSRSCLRKDHCEPHPFPRCVHFSDQVEWTRDVPCHNAIICNLETQAPILHSIRQDHECSYGFMASAEAHRLSMELFLDDWNEELQSYKTEFEPKFTAASVTAPLTEVSSWNNPRTSFTTSTGQLEQGSRGRFACRLRPVIELPEIITAETRPEPWRNPPTWAWPTWVQDVWLLLARFGEVLQLEEGPTCSLVTGYLHHLNHRRCLRPRIWRLDDIIETWEPALRHLWADFINNREALSLYRVNPSPPQEGQPFLWPFVVSTRPWPGHPHPANQSLGRSSTFATAPSHTPSSAITYDHSTPNSNRHV